MAKFAKIIQENNENILIKKFIRLFRTKIRKADSLLELCKTFLTEKQRVEKKSKK